MRCETTDTIRQKQIAQSVVLIFTRRILRSISSLHFVTSSRFYTQLQNYNSILRSIPPDSLLELLMNKAIVALTNTAADRFSKLFTLRQHQAKTPKAWGYSCLVTESLQNTQHASACDGSQHHADVCEPLLVRKKSDQAKDSGGCFLGMLNSTG